MLTYAMRTQKFWPSEQQTTAQSPAAVRPRIRTAVFAGIVLVVV